MVPNKNVTHQNLIVSSKDLPGQRKLAKYDDKILKQSRTKLSIYSF